MKEKTMNMFGREYRFKRGAYGLWESERKIHSLAQLGTAVEKPQILLYGGSATIHFRTDDSVLEYDLLSWLYDERQDEQQNFRDCLLALSDEDIEWTRKRNEGLTGVFYRKITFKPETQVMIKRKLRDYQTALGTWRDEIAQEIREEEERIAQEKREWAVVKVYRDIAPRGGETGVDGYHDALYQSSATGDTIRVVSRDVFDFGCYHYPKRVENTNDVFNRDRWTDEEKMVVTWVYKYGPFHGVRM